MRVRTIAIAGFSVALAVVLAACGGGGGTSSANGSSATSPAPTTVASTAPATVASGTGSPSTGTSGSASVGTATFRADLTIQQSGLGLLALTNTGKQTVTVQGWPTLTFLNAANEPVHVAVQKVPVPGAGPSIPIGPGETAFAGVKWSSGDKGDPKTAVATSISLTVPGGSKPMNVNIIGTNGQSGGYVEFDLVQVQVGTLQPSSQGVLVF